MALRQLVRKVIRVVVTGVVVVGLVAAAYLAWDRLSRVSRADLEQIVRRDGLTLRTASIPPPVIDRLASHRVVLLGEHHFLKEHRELVAELLRELHARGFRQYLFEWTQAADWLLADYVTGGRLAPEFKPPHDVGGHVLAAIRDLNLAVPDHERILVHGIDLHLADYGGTGGWNLILGMLANHLPNKGPLTAYLAGDHATYTGHQSLLRTLQRELERLRPELLADWGAGWYATVVEMVEVELQSLEVRNLRESDYVESVRLREIGIQRLADRRIGSCPGGTLINFGSTHAQKKGLWGTAEVEWLGDYLVHRSPVVHGSIMACWVTAARVMPVPGSGNPTLELTASPSNELLRVISLAWPNERVFLPLDDPLFRSGRVPLNNSGSLYVGAPAQHYDAILLLPLAHRDFVGD